MKTVTQYEYDPQLLNRFRATTTPAIVLQPMPAETHADTVAWWKQRTKAQTVNSEPTPPNAQELAYLESTRQKSYRCNEERVQWLRESRTAGRRADRVNKAYAPKREELAQRVYDSMNPDRPSEESTAE